MNQSIRLFVCTAAAILAAACSSGGAGTLGGVGEEDPGTPGTQGTPPTAGKTGTPTPVASSTPAPTGSSTTPPASTPPSAGPGSAGSAGHTYFVANVYPAITNCAGCHANGTLGAPKILGADATSSYLALDANAMIVSDSQLISHVHSAPSAPNPTLTSSQNTVITAWLAIEATDRAGQAAPVNILDTAAKCGDPTKFPTGLTKLLTKARTNENTNNCTGCDRTQCASCHGDKGNATNVVISNGTTALNTDMLSFDQTADGIASFIGINGTQLVASDLFKNKSAATVADTSGPNVPKHPQFLIDAPTQAAIDAYAADIVAKYAAGTCPK